MLKKSVAFLAAFLMLGPTGLVYGAEPNSKDTFDVTQLNKGVISINYQQDRQNGLKVMIQKDQTRYFYNLGNNNSFPLQFGNGQYTIGVLENAQGNQYKLLESKQVSLNIADSAEVYLNPIQNISWNSEMASVKKAQELTANLTTDYEKVTAIYNYLVNNLTYDYAKITQVSSDYIPDLEITFSSSTGICYDYASLLAAMLRSVGIPTKMVMGYRMI